MKTNILVVLLKENEPGLLSIIDYRIKSMIPVLGGARILDYYINEEIQHLFDSVFIIVHKDFVAVRDYFFSNYNTKKLKLVQAVDPSQELMKLLTRQDDSIIILRADGILNADWHRLGRQLFSLNEGARIQAKSGQLIGFISTADSKFLEKYQRWVQNKGKVTNKADELWDQLVVLGKELTAVVPEVITYYPLHTVHNYFEFHFSQLADLKSFTQKAHLSPDSWSREEDIATIGEHGKVMNSFISPSCIVEGTVENSILFPGVKVAVEVTVSHSIILSRNYIGGGGKIQNTIICEGNEIFSKISPNIEEGVHIGEDDMTGANGQFPDFIFGGITLLGQNVGIPHGFRIPRNCFIGSQVTRAQLKERGMVKAGDTVLAHGDNYSDLINSYT